MNELTVGSLFAGIGGFDLGLERAGMRTLWFAESDPYCQRVLAKHWPGVPCYPDVRGLVADADEQRLHGNASGDGQPDGWSDGLPCDVDGRADFVGRCAAPVRRAVAGPDAVPVSVPPVDVLCGGFPCQDISVAGRGAGIDGARSGLWSEFARLIGELRPRYVIVENVPALLTRGMGRVLADLAALGYDAEWDCIPASAIGAPHRRDRVWIVAYSDSERGNGAGTRSAGREEPADSGGGAGELADSARVLRDGSDDHTGGRGEGTGTLPEPRDRGGDQGAESGWWATEPSVGRVANGIPHQVDRLRALGNALVPQIAEWLGRRVMEHEAR